MNYSILDPASQTFPSNNLTAFENTGVNITYICVWAFSLLFSLPTNSYVIWLIITGSEDRVASEIFVLNVSFSEIISCLYGVIYLDRIVHPSFDKSVQITMLRFLTGNIITIRPLFQCLMCVERYLAVVHPVTFLKYKPLRYRLICCAVVWIIGFGSCFFWLFVIVATAFMWISLIQFLVFLSIQLFCLVAVLRALKQSGPSERRRDEENQLKKRAFKIIVIVTVTTLGSVVPFILSRLINIMLQRDLEEVSLFSLWCLVLDGFLPALLYLRRVGKMPFFKPP